MKKDFDLKAEKKSINIKLPEVSELTDQQKEILDETGAVAIYGGAGTGKTVLSIWKHILNWEERYIKSYLITYTHSLTKYLFESIKTKSLKASQHIENKDRFTNNPNIEMLIIDEAQDIPIEDYINNNRKVTGHKTYNSLYEKISYGADNKQILYPDHNSTQEELNDAYQNKEFFLKQNFRNSYEILNFVKNIFPTYGISKEMINHSKEKFLFDEKPIIYYSKDKSNRDLFIISLLKKLQKNKIAILIPTIKMFHYYKKILENNKIEFSYYNNEQKGDIRYKGIENIHLTTFKSSKGLEFDSIIIPESHNLNYWAKKDDKSIINANDYYVGMSRAKEQLYLISDNKEIFDINQLKIDSSLYEIENI